MTTRSRKHNDLQRLAIYLQPVGYLPPADEKTLSPFAVVGEKFLALNLRVFHFALHKFCAHKQQSVIVYM